MKKKMALAAALLVAMLTTSSQADTLLSDFSNFNLTGTYVQWDSGTFTSNADNFRVEANDFGGGFFNFDSPIDGSGNNYLQVLLSVNADNVADKFNTVLIDADGTERVYRFGNLAVGDNQLLSVNLDNFLQDNNAGSTPGLDLANLTVFHLQGTFENGDPGLAQDLTFDNLALTVVPEPTSTGIVALGLLGMMIKRRRK